MIFSSKGRKYLLLVVIGFISLVIYFRSQETSLSSPVATSCSSCVERSSNEKSAKELHAASANLHIDADLHIDDTIDLDHMTGRQDVDWNRVFYNRVPKCGSRGVQAVIYKLSKQLHFKYMTSRVYSPHYLVNQTEVRC